MPRRKARKNRTPDHLLAIFEIKSWEPSYSFSVNRSDDNDRDYSEYAELYLDTRCVYPEKLAGRTANIIASRRRKLFEAPNPRRDPSQKPDSLGLLHLPPSGGNFYGGIPHDSLPFIVAALATEQFRYVMVSGPSLKRSHCLATELHFSRTAE